MRLGDASWPRCCVPKAASTVESLNRAGLPSLFRGVKSQLFRAFVLYKLI